MEGSLHFSVSQAYTQREICISKAIGLAHSWKQIYVSNLQKVLTETLCEDVNISEMQLKKYFVYTMSVCTKEIKAKSEEELGKQQ